MSVLVYHYAGCSTCKQALAWLRARGIAPETIDLVDAPPSATVLAGIREAAGVDARKLFNVTGQVYRGEGWAERVATLDEAALLSALAGNGRLIKRPILVVRSSAGTRACVGFREAQWAAALA